MLIDSATCRCALREDFEPTIVLRSNPPQQQQEQLDNASLQRRSTTSSTSTSGLRFPNAIPRQRPNWLANDAASQCLVCRRAFSLLWRRHHCRSCGFLICAEVIFFNRILFVYLLIIVIIRKCCDKVALPLLGYASKQLTCVRCIDTFYSGFYCSFRF